MKGFHIFSIAVLILAGCSHEPLPVAHGTISNGPVIKSTVSIPQTKAISDAATLISERVISIDDEWQIVETVYDNNRLPFAPATRGSVITDATIGAFNMVGYAESAYHDNTIPSGTGSLSSPYPAGQYFNSSVSVTLNAGSYTGTIASSPKWINNVAITMWSWAPTSVSPGLTYSVGGSSATFSYTVANAAADQKDLIFAYNQETRKFDSTGAIESGTGTYNTSNKTAISVNFAHALSEVFVEEGSLNGYSISNVSFENVNKTITGGVITGGTSCSFNYSGKLSNSGTVSSSSTSEKFFLVPQSLSGINLSVTLTKDGSDISKTAAIYKSTDDVTSWEAGKYYKYKINYTAPVIEVIYDVDDSNSSLDNFVTLTGLDVTDKGQPVVGQKYANPTVYVYASKGISSVTIGGATASAGGTVTSGGKTYTKYSITASYTASLSSVSTGEKKDFTVVVTDNSSNTKTETVKLPIWGISLGGAITSSSAISAYNVSSPGSGLLILHNDTRNGWLYNSGGGISGKTGDTNYDYNSLLAFSGSSNFNISSPLGWYGNRYISGVGSVSMSSSGTTYGIDTEYKTFSIYNQYTSFSKRRWYQNSATGAVALQAYVLTDNIQQFSLYPVTLVEPS